MVLICDRGVTERAKNLRERMLMRGIPAAVSALSSIRAFLPVRLFVCYTDVFDDLRRLPYGNVRCIAVGEGFVNSALNAVRVGGEEEAIASAWHGLALRGPDASGFGCHLTPEIFRGPGFYEIRGHTVLFTRIEERIFLCLALAGNRCVSVENLRAFSLPGDREKRTEGAIAMHVCNLNAKLAPALGERPIREKRYYGYYLEGI